MTTSHYSKYILLFTLLLFTACGGGGGGDSATSQSLKDTTEEKLSEDASSKHAVVIRSQVVNRGDTATNSFVTQQCGSLGGTAIYTGVDSNANGILDLSEQNDTPQVVCNGGTGTAPTITMNQLSTGDAHCADGGIELILGTQTSYLCNGSASNGGTTTPKSTDYTGAGGIVGKVNLSHIRSFIKQRRLTSTSGKLWLTPSQVNAAVIADKKEVAAGKTAIPKPITKAVEINIQDDDTYAVNDVPAGEYSLVYVDNVKSEGTKIDNIIVQPDENTSKNITQVRPTGSVVLQVSSLNLNQNLENATVRVNELDINATTDSNGSTKIENLPAGNYSLSIIKDGYVPKYISFNVLSAKETNLQAVQLNTEKGQLSGSVVAQNVEDLANIIMYAKSADGSLYTALTDNSGHYSFTGVPVGAGYSVLAYAHDFSASKVSDLNVTENNTTLVSEISLKRNLVQEKQGSITGFARFSDINEILNHAGIVVSVLKTSENSNPITNSSISLHLLEHFIGYFVLNFKIFKMPSC